MCTIIRQEFPFSHVETQRNDLVCSSDDDGEVREKLKPTDTRLNAPIIDRIVNGSRLPPAPTQAIFKIPVICVSNFDSSTGKGKGFYLRGQGLDSNDEVDKVENKSIFLKAFLPSRMENIFYQLLTKIITLQFLRS